MLRAACVKRASDEEGEGMDLAGRCYARVYRVNEREDVHTFLRQAVTRSGGQVLHASDASRAPVYLGVRTTGGQRLGLLVYPFRMTRVLTSGRPSDEVRGQIRYGGEETWRSDDHAVGRDLAGVDITLMVAVDLERGVLVGLDPALYDPLPMGISMYAKESQLAAAGASSWHVWERENRGGSRRAAPRAQGGLETLVAFTPERFLDYARFEQTASDLGLDGPLRYSAAQDAATTVTASAGSRHPLEQDFDLAASDILAIIADRTRLEVAVRGGVAEHHLQRVLDGDIKVAAADRLDHDSQHDFDVVMADGRTVRLECKNASPEGYANGDLKVEVQKTRASKKDPASRFYRVDQFDIVAACLYSPTRQWTFRFSLTSVLPRHRDFADRLAPMQRIDAAWASDLATALRPAAACEAAGAGAPRTPPRATSSKATDFEPPARTRPSMSDPPDTLGS
ncbi:hypothetical protein WDZ17_14825 [Pseudokineococcus basanitobsidens]|uniref:Methylase-associated X1 domain-containing protein n=1 Tax=Pseudokineococcus basanitobsidens TaxID=1926649 RepID=A0ABU8RNA1_9ACTN